jgi:hypothetical protein
MKTDPAVINVFDTNRFCHQTTFISVISNCFIALIFLFYFLVLTTNYCVAVFYYAGPSAKESVQSIADPQELRFLNHHARKFYQEAIQQIQAHFNFSDNFFTIVNMRRVLAMHS